jgi:hypothetical protein
MNIICFLTLRPSKLFYNFCKKLIKDNYDVYICIDDNSYNIPDYDNIIKIIKIDNQECINAGFKSTVLYFQDKACARDKALYYFCKNDINYNFIWFIEEDVFIPRPEIISEIDAEYPDADLVCKQNVSHDEDPAFLWWYDADPMLQEPLYRSLVCACRLSRALLNKIVQFVDKHNRLVFLWGNLCNSSEIHERLA